MKKTLLALALIGVSATASADALVYGGASAGQSNLGGESSTSYNVHVGTGILPFIALEAGFQDFGEFKNATYDNVKRDLQASAVYFAVKPSMDFGPLHVYARAGLHSYELKGKNSGFNEDEIDMMYGVGAEYFAMGPFSLGASYNVFSMKKENIENFALNATFHFL
ncbi:outer membrane beta-barrel protein [Vibrio caribbeanicus]|uniref:outer membrane beta-barrel protein n=1 Tax=Vibrio caribbeanicus TaxID=701175 RepID=UPI002283E3B9|nr:outer membrane beta-barrel protein [Vibrio caribbeanicus]MCY9844727.1 outer membrane beta-barrel protein [Vibrio caribbeanicus]